MINIALVYAPPSKEYRDVIWSSKDAPSPPQTGAVELTAYLKKYSKKELNIICIPSQKTDGNKIKYFTNKEIINLCKRRDFIGFTCLYHNQNRTIEIATQLKKENPNTKIILGGQNVSSKFIAELILNKAKEIDYIVCGDGEKALLGIIENKNKKQIPNIAYRTNEKIEFTKRKATNLDKIPVWDYEAIINKNDILDAHDSRTKTYKELLKKYNGRTPPEIGVFSQRGCPKAYGELGGPKGPCIYCTSWESSRNKMHPDKFWKQIKFLYEKYGLQDFFIGDNVFGTSINELKEFIKWKKKNKTSKNIQFRVYTYPAIIISKDGKKISKYLKKLGVVNVFLGVETFNKRASILSNKHFTNYKTVEKSVKVLSQAGLDIFIAFMPGLPGETKENLGKTLKYIKKLVSKYGSKEYNKGNIVRVDISPAMPLVGSTWHAQLVNNKKIKQDYFYKTGKELEFEICPDFTLLRNLSLKYNSDTTKQDIRSFEIAAKTMLLKYLNPESLGGFDLKLRDIKQIQRINKGLWNKT